MLRTIINLSKVNKLSKVHPIEKIILFLFPIVILAFVRDLTMPVLLNIAVMIVLNMIIESPKHILIKFVKGIFIFSLLTSITVVFDYGIKHTVILILKSLSGVLCIFSFVITTPMEDVFYLTSNIKGVREINDIAKNMIRFLILVEDEYFIITKAMESRLGLNSVGYKIKNIGKILGILFINILNRWKEIKDSIDSRGYSGKTVYMERDYKFSGKRFLGICLYNIILVTSIFYANF
ncbi:cobalt ABC transporter permease protein CbiQ [Gottschalkia purinilytica]|uniref:Cobalt ABC transporter permease protein CbiQ n=1 Tax=Gottschalkia purinilytica TaxID=1503 RepID=A0A0L0W786_GOTPU|nr:energy-coupling factor transporter transmembrane component T [Gottschalkia purinilytica]KNF07341.1 cobalt ABC transporter permease protein CbiQ [Gottschalkia purinilytica]